MNGEQCLGVVVPVFNERRTLDEILTRVLSQSSVIEVVAVDDASTDGSWEILERWRETDSRVKIRRHERNRGKGAAVRSGFAMATAPIIVVQDADLEYDPRDFARLIAPIRTGACAVVYGSRFVAGNAHGSPWHHRLVNAALTAVSNRASGLRLTDSATCYKAFRRDVLAGLSLEEDRFGFCPEVTAKVARLGLEIREVPISYIGRTHAQGKKIRWRDGLDALRCIVRYNFFA